MPSAVASRKRKQMDDADSSPPKRVTRARAAVTARDPTKPSTRRTAIHTGGEEDAQAEMKSSAASVAKARGRPKKTAEPPSAKTTVIYPPKTRGRPPKARTEAPSNPQTTTGAQTRARPIAPRAAANENSDDDELAVAEPTRSRPTNSRRAATATAQRTIRVTAPSTRLNASRPAVTAASSRATSATASTNARNAGVVGRRRVVLADNASDKENRPVSRGKDGKTTTFILAGSGLQGQPVRRHAQAASTAVSASAKTGPRSQTQADEERPKTPLSPKKVDQVAKGNWSGASHSAVDYASSSEDELSGAAVVRRTRSTRPLQKSPVRPPPSAQKETGVAKEKGLCKENDQAPSSDSSADREAVVHSLEGVLQSRSPIRPPSSPTKLTQFGQSTKPFNRPPSRDGAQPISEGASLLRSPAKRPPSRDVASSVDLQAGSLQCSTTKTSRMDSLEIDRPAQPQTSPKKNLLQSPARRPKVPGAMTAIAKEKRPVSIFGDSSKPNQHQVFRFSAATPRRINVLKPSQNLLDQIPEISQEQSLSSLNNSPKAPDDAESEADVSMLDVNENTIIYTPSKSRSTLFDSPLPSRSRSRSPGKLAEQTSEKTTSLSISALAVPERGDRRISRTLFRDARAHDSDDDTTLGSVARDSSVSASADIKSPANSEAVTPSRSARRKSRQQTRESLMMTPLAHQFGAWLAASPEKDSADSLQPEEIQPSVEEANGDGTQMRGPQEIIEPFTDTGYFNDEMAARERFEVPQVEDEETAFGAISLTGLHEDSIQADMTEQASYLNVSEENNPTQTELTFDMDMEVNDENAFPLDPALTLNDQTWANPVESADPLTLKSTPARSVRPPPQEILTVSKVPLKAADSALTASPTKAFRKKSHSLAPSTSIPGPLLDQDDLLSLSTPKKDQGEQAEMDTSGTLTTPRKTPRSGADAQVLRGAVVYVDVHTTEGANASSLFIELLTQMGARCVKQWNWNPSASTTVGETPGGSKVGITHIVYKDGGKRTLEKARMARGLVSCVGVGWVLDCERRNEWLDESAYAIDTSIVPRGGHNRRKSMEPRALENNNGTLKLAPLTPARDQHRRSVSTPVACLSPTKGYLDFTPGPQAASGADTSMFENNATPTISGPTFSAQTPTINYGNSDIFQGVLPETPAILKSVSWDLDTPSASMGEAVSEIPSTPLAATVDNPLVQATCPPKQQTGRRLLPGGGLLSKEPDEDIRRRLELVRRKSLQWAPKIGSPLRKM